MSWDMDLLRSQMKEFMEQNYNKVFVFSTTNKRVLNMIEELETGGRDKIARPELFKPMSNRSNMRVMKITPITICFILRSLKRYPYECSVYISENKWMGEFPEELERLADWDGSYVQLENRLEVSTSGY